MNGVSMLRALYAYNHWAISAILDEAEGLEPGQLTAPTAMPHESLWATLFHALGAEWLWVQRCRGASPDHLLPEPQERTVGAFRALWERQHADSLALIDSLDEQALGQVVQYTSTRGHPFQNRMGDILLHAGTHVVQHRAEAAQILTGFGRSPGDLDYDDYVHEEKE